MACAAAVLGGGHKILPGLEKFRLLESQRCGKAATLLDLSVCSHHVPALHCMLPFTSKAANGYCASKSNPGQSKPLSICRNKRCLTADVRNKPLTEQLCSQKISGGRKSVVLEATGRIGGQVWTEPGHNQNQNQKEADRKDSGAEASTSNAIADQYGDDADQHWQEKTDEETERFVQRQQVQPPSAKLGEKNGHISTSTGAATTSWQVVGGLCTVAALGVTGYSFYEKERYEAALRERRSVESTATVGFAAPMPPAPRDWAPWQVLPLSLALLITLFSPRPQTVLISTPRGPLPGTSESSGLALRVHRLEEEFDSGIKTVRFLSRQLEKLGVRFRLSRRTLRDPIRENTDNLEAAKAELALVNARLLRLEEGLFEAQELMLAMQEQQAKQFSVLAAALPKVAAAQRQFAAQRNAGKQKAANIGPTPSGLGQKSSSAQRGKAPATPAKAVQAKTAQILGSIRVPFVGEHSSKADEDRRGGGGAKRPTNEGGASTRGDAVSDESLASVKKAPRGPATVVGLSMEGGVSAKDGRSTEGRLAEASAEQNGAPGSQHGGPGQNVSGKEFSGPVGTRSPLKELSARDAESLVKDVEVPERFIEEKARWEAYKNSLIDRKVDLPGQDR